jgi:excisionase family DNA binding protein
MKTPKPKRTVLDEWKEAKLEFVCPPEIQEKLVPAFAEFIRQTFRQHLLPKGWMKARQAAAYMGVHYQTFLDWVGDGEMDVPKIPLPGAGKDFRYMKEMLDEWAWNRAINAPPRPGKKPPR